MSTVLEGQTLQSVRSKTNSSGNWFNRLWCQNRHQHGALFPAAELPHLLEAWRLFWHISPFRKRNTTDCLQAKSGICLWWTQVSTHLNLIPGIRCVVFKWQKFHVSLIPCEFGFYRYVKNNWNKCQFHLFVAYKYDCVSVISDWRPEFSVSINMYVTGAVTRLLATHNITESVWGRCVNLLSKSFCLIDTIYVFSTNRLGMLIRKATRKARPWLCEMKELS